jgi:hypothetical protein
MNKLPLALYVLLTFRDMPFSQRQMFHYHRSVHRNFIPAIGGA